MYSFFEDLLFYLFKNTNKKNYEYIYRYFPDEWKVAPNKNKDERNAHFVLKIFTKWFNDNNNYYFQEPFVYITKGIFPYSSISFIYLSMYLSIPDYQELLNSTDELEKVMDLCPFDESKDKSGYLKKYEGGCNSKKTAILTILNFLNFPLPGYSEYLRDLTNGSKNKAKMKKLKEIKINLGNCKSSRERELKKSYFTSLIDLLIKGIEYQNKEIQFQNQQQHK